MTFIPSQLRQKRLLFISIFGLFSLTLVAWFFWSRPLLQIEGIDQFAFRSDAKSLLTLSKGRLSTYTIQLFTRQSEWDLEGQTVQARFSDDGAWLARETANTIEVWHVADRNRTSIITGLSPHPYYLIWSHDSTILTRLSRVNGTTTLMQWRLDAGIVRETRKPVSVPNPRAISPDGQMYVVDDSMGTLTIKRLRDDVVLQTISQADPVSFIDVFAFSNDGALLAGGSGGGKVIWVWQIQNGALVATLPRLRGSVYGLAWNSTSTMLAAATGDPEVFDDGGVQIWGVANQKLIANYDYLNDYSGVAFSQDDTIIASIRKEDRELQLWSVP